MSNTSTNYAELNVTNDDMKEVLAEGTSAPAAAEAAPKKQKNIGYRILALILTIAPIVCLCLLPVKLLVSTSAGYAFYGKETILDAFLALFKKDGLAEFYAEVAKTISGAAASGFDSYTLKGIPVLAGTGALGKAMSLVMYALPIAAILAIVFMVIAHLLGQSGIRDDESDPVRLFLGIRRVCGCDYGRIPLQRFSRQNIRHRDDCDCRRLLCHLSDSLLYQGRQAHLDDVASVYFDGRLCRRHRIRNRQLRGRYQGIDGFCGRQHHFRRNGRSVL